MALKQKNVFVSTRRYMNFIKGKGISWAVIISPIFSLLAALFEAMSMVILMPLVKLVLYKDPSIFKNVSIFQYMLPIFSEKVKSENTAMLLVMISVLLGFIVIKNILIYFSAFILEKNVCRFRVNIQKEIFSRYLSFGKMYFDLNSSARLNVVINYFTERIAMMLSHLQAVITATFMVIAYIAIMLRISVSLTSIAILITFGYIYISKALFLKIKKNSETLGLVGIKGSVKTLDAFNCMPIIKASNREKSELKKISDIWEHDLCARISIAKKRNLLPFMSDMALLPCKAVS